MKKSALAAVITLLLSGCGGGSDSSTSQDQVPRHVTGTIERVDNVNKTITVNGHDFNFNRVGYAGETLTTPLQENMMVSVSMAARSEVTVEMEPTLVGQITITNGTSFTVNGITLNFDLSTSDIENGDWVMVSSLPTANGYKVLSVVEFEQGEQPDQVEVEGLISNLDMNANTFKIGAAITVEFTNNVIEDNAELSDGQWVEVTGNLDGANLTANTIEVEDYDDLEDDNEIEGVITWVNADKSRLELNRRGQFIVEASTRFEDGDSTNLIAGQIIELTAVQRNGKNVATEIEFDDNDNDSDWGQQDFEHCGIIKNIQLDSKGGATGFEIGTHSIIIDAQTSYDDGLSISLTDGLLVEVEGLIINGKNIAREIELDDEYSCNL